MGERPVFTLCAKRKENEKHDMAFDTHDGELPDDTKERSILRT